MFSDRVNFNEYALKFDSYRTSDSYLVDTLIEYLNINKNMKLLDYGCGTGNYLVALKTRGFTNLCGLDKSEEMCALARKKTGLTIKQGDEKNIPFEKNYFDAILIIDVLHFIHNLDSLFLSLNETIKLGGQVFIATQSIEQLKTRIYAKYFPSAFEIDKKRHHQINEIVTRAKKLGFEDFNIIKYKENTDVLVDEQYLKLIKNKAFYILGLIPDNEFADGIAMMEKDLVNGSFVAKFPGRTIVTLRKTKLIEV